jgi:hypothetical protein
MSRLTHKKKFNKAICKAIGTKAILQFEYHGTLRTIEPQSHGISSAGNEVVRAVQTHPHAQFGTSIEGKLFEVSKMSGLKETGAHFIAPGPHYNPDDKGMVYVHCHL